ncbi:MAG: S-methyl-5-thioribose-1-phosphate isomerase [Actinobacteria bacterium]|nr:S-methyl-5-thioribose-1-phosphate isomerase [Actinomycetota bacterium]
MTDPPRAITWTGSAIQIIDQTALPSQLTVLTIDKIDDLISAIQRLAVRGAPALGAVGGLGVVLALAQAQREGWSQDSTFAAIERLRQARPTAVNLARGVDRVRARLAEGPAAVLKEALSILAEDEAANRLIGVQGADWILAHVSQRPLRVLTHCNTGSLATAAYGTALGIIRQLHHRGVLEVVYVDETRPLLQGSRLTAWELAADGIAHLVQPDAAAASTVLDGLVDVAVIGADRIAANGDTANKIGSLGIALACADAHIPFVVAAPEDTIDFTTPTGEAITIEHRADAELLTWGEMRLAPAATRAYNPAFDITPARLVTALVTPAGVLEVARGHRPDTSPISSPPRRAAGVWSGA